MAYDDTRYRGTPGYGAEPQSPSGSDYSDQSGYGAAPLYSPASQPVASGYAEGADSTMRLGRRSPSRAELDDVFDDPAHGDPGRDRLAVHLQWEGVLLVSGAVLAGLLFAQHRSAVTGDKLTALMLDAAVLGLLSLGAGLSLRAAVPNLAIGPIAYGSAVYFAHHLDGPVLTRAGITVALALAVGAVIALLVVVLQVPAWAASFGAAIALVLWIQRHSTPVKVTTFQPGKHAMYWLAGVAGLALLGSLLGTVKPIRRAVGRFRPVADPARRRGAGSGVVAVLALIGSAALASAGGVLLASVAGTVGGPDNSLLLTGLALGTALLGGTSAYGRRGGIFGTVLAVAVVVLGGQYLTSIGHPFSPLAVAAVAIGVGLGVTRLVEAFGRPRSSVEDEDWLTPESAGTSTGAPDLGGWSAGRTGWTSPTATSEDRWGAERRWTS